MFDKIKDWFQDGRKGRTIKKAAKTTLEGTIWAVSATMNLVKKFFEFLTKDIIVKLLMNLRRISEKDRGTLEKTIGSLMAEGKTRVVQISLTRKGKDGKYQTIVADYDMGTGTIRDGYDACSNDVESDLKDGRVNIYEFS